MGHYFLDIEYLWQSERVALLPGGDVELVARRELNQAHILHSTGWTVYYRNSVLHLLK